MESLKVLVISKVMSYSISKVVNFWNKNILMGMIEYLRPSQFVTLIGVHRLVEEKDVLSRVNMVSTVYWRTIHYVSFKFLNNN